MPELDIRSAMTDGASFLWEDVESREGSQAVCRGVRQDLRGQHHQSWGHWQEELEESKGCHKTASRADRWRESCALDSAGHLLQGSPSSALSSAAGCVQPGLWD